MNSELKIYNSLGREEEVFQPILREESGCMHVGLPYTAMFIWAIVALSSGFGIIYRYLRLLGYKVRDVRNEAVPM